MFEDFSTKAFNSLPHFNEAKKSIPLVKKSLKDLFEIIKNHKLEKVIGICLLHRHFKLNENEKLVETFYKDFTLIKPEIKGEFTPYIWKFDDNKWTPLEFVSKFEDQMDFLENKKFLKEISEKFKQLKLENVVGISLLHRDQIANADSTNSTMETSDEIQRILKVQTLDKAKESKDIPDEHVQTLWNVPGTNTLCGHSCRHVCINHY